MIIPYMYFKAALTGILAVLFLLPVVWRPKQLIKYSYKQKLSMSFNPLRSGKETIQVEDWSTLKWYRSSGLTMATIILTKLLAGIFLWYISVYYPHML